MVGKFTCRDVAEIMTDYIEGSMSFRDRFRFHLHLGMCTGCRNYLRQMKQTIATLGKLPAEPVPPHVRDELLKRFRNWKK